MTVRHDLENFQEGRDVILTLADSKILDEGKINLFEYDSLSSNN